MKNELLDSTLRIADLHSKRLKYAMEKLVPSFPISGDHFSRLSDTEIPIFELFSSRFTKLQDLMGAKLFGLVLEEAKEPGEFVTFLDKLHKLEKLGVIPDSQEWLLLREIRNHLSHEYPENPEINAKYFNMAYEKANYLIECLERIKVFLDKLS